MPFVKPQQEVNEDTRGMSYIYSILYIDRIMYKLLLIITVAGYDPLLSPRYLQSEVPSV